MVFGCKEDNLSQEEIHFVLLLLRNADFYEEIIGKCDKFVDPDVSKSFYGFKSLVVNTIISPVHSERRRAEKKLLSCGIVKELCSFFSDPIFKKTVKELHSDFIDRHKEDMTKILTAYIEKHGTSEDVALSRKMTFEELKDLYNV